jgi:hypothetical protein
MEDREKLLTMPDARVKQVTTDDRKLGNHGNECMK